jgi:hypothetical protein
LHWLDLTVHQLKPDELPQPGSDSDTGGCKRAAKSTTLLGLSEVLEGGVFPPTAAWPRASFTGLFNSSVPVPTRFLPTPSPNFLP